MYSMTRLTDSIPNTHVLYEMKGANYRLTRPLAHGLIIMWPRHLITWVTLGALDGGPPSRLLI